MGRIYFIQRAHGKPTSMARTSGRLFRTYSFWRILSSSHLGRVRWGYSVVHRKSCTCDTVTETLRRPASHCREQGKAVTGFVCFSTSIFAISAFFTARTRYVLMFAAVFLAVFSPTPGLAQSYISRIYGFKIHQSSAYHLNNKEAGVNGESGSARSSRRKNSKKEKARQHAR